MLPSPVLSLHYLLGYLSAVVPVLSCVTIKVATFVCDSILKCSPEVLAVSFRFFLLLWMITVFSIFPIF